jgi:uncharacterized protein YqeY
MPNIYEKLRADIVIALKARDSGKALILRSADAAIQRTALDSDKPIDDDLVVATLRKSVKNLTAANAEFKKGGRDDLIEANDREIAVLDSYLPQMIGGDQLEGIIDEAVAATGARSRKDMGRVIGAIKKRPDSSLIDFGAVSKALQGKLS